MRLGICLPQMGLNTTPGVIDEFIDVAEEVGFDSLWVEEHLFRPLEPTTPFGGVTGREWPDQHRRFLAPLELLAYAAGRTSRCTLGTSILVAGYHHPLVLAKRVATIDTLSRGRMALGVGVGWCEDEYDLLDADFTRRGALTDELLEALLACWASNPVSYDGEHFSIPPSETSPKPHAGDHVTLVGGFLSPAGRRRAARLCDVWQPYRLEPEEAVRDLAALNELAADEFGRGPLELSLRVLVSPEIPGLAGGGITSTGAWAGDIAALAEQVRRAAAAGCHEIVMDTSFAPSTGDQAVWRAQPEFFRPLVELAHEA